MVNSKNCPTCDKIRQRKVKDRPPYEELIIMIKENGYESIGRKYGVSGKAVKNWIIRYENPNTPRRKRNIEVIKVINI